MRSLYIVLFLAVLASCKPQPVPDKFATADRFVTCVCNDDVACAASLLANDDGSPKADTLGLSHHIHLLHTYFDRYGTPPRHTWKIFSDLRSPIVQYDCIEIPACATCDTTNIEFYSIVLDFDRSESATLQDHIIEYDLRSVNKMYTVENNAVHK